MSCPGVSHEATDCGFWSCCTQRLYRLLVGCSVFRLGSRTCKLSNRTRMRRSAVAFLRSLGAGASGSTETAVSKLSQQVMQGRRCDPRLMGTDITILRRPSPLSIRGWMQ